MYKIKNEAWSPQAFIDELFGYCPIINHIDVSDRVFIENEISENGYNYRSFDLSEMDKIVNEKVNVALVQCLDDNGEYEYVFFEVPEDFNSDN